MRCNRIKKNKKDCGKVLSCHHGEKRGPNKVSMKAVVKEVKKRITAQNKNAYDIVKEL